MFDGSPRTPCSLAGCETALVGIDKNRNLDNACGDHEKTMDVHFVIQVNIHANCGLGQPCNVNNLLQLDNMERWVEETSARRKTATEDGCEDKDGRASR